MMTDFPILESERLLLNNLQATDIKKIIEFAGNIKIANNTLNMPHPYAEKDAIFWINSANEGFQNKTQYTFAIRLLNSNEFIGGIGLKVNSRFDRAELGYWIGEPHWNNGYTTEAAKLVLEFGFNDLGLNKIFAVHAIENEASGKVMIKNNMVEEGLLKDHFKKGNVYKTVRQYRLTKAEFENSK